MSEPKANIEKEKSPFGPWLLVSYGKQGSRSIKGKVWKSGNGSANPTTRYGNVKNGHEDNNKSGSDNDNRKMGAEFTEVKYGKKYIVKNGNANSISNRTSGSRFDVLNEETEMSMNEENHLPKAQLSGSKLKETVILSEITNLNGSQDDRSGKGSKKGFKKVDNPVNKKAVPQGKNKYSRDTMGTSNNLQEQHKSTQDSRFEVVAATLEEAMSEILE
ncbi:hypothetical protein Q3G72_003218 [Acer saccharum]|nr:hypothetical protein Q3G72_003218 [Acer saccharum]